MFARLRPSLDKYLAITRVNLQNQLTYSGDLLWRSVFMVIIMYIFIQLWGATYKSQNTNQISGMTLSDVIWYLVMAETVVLGNIRFAEQVAEEVRDGTIAYQLNRPYNYLLYHFSNGLGDALIRSTLTFGIGAIIAWLAFGPPPIELFSAPAVVLVLSLSFILDFCIHGVIALSAFVIEDVTAFLLIYQKLTFIVGGLLLPVDFLPTWLKRIAGWLPFQLVPYAPAKLFVNFEPGRFAHLLTAQFIWLGVLILALVAMYRWGVRRVSINGG